MLKHRGFPGRMPGSDYQFIIRRGNPKGVTPLKRLERFKDRKAVDRAADRIFMAALWDHFGEEPFERGNLDAARLSWLFGREVKAYTDPFDPKSYEALLIIDAKIARVSFPEVFDTGEGDALDEEDWSDEDDDADFDDEDDADFDDDEDDEDDEASA